MLISLTIFVKPSTVTAASSASVDVLFVLYDAGETFGLHPVWTALQANSVRHSLLLFGTSRRIASSAHHRLDAQRDCGVSKEVGVEGWHREQTLNARDLKHVLGCVTAKVIVTGTNAALQKQIAEAYGVRGANVLSFYDSLAPLSTNPLAYEFVTSSAAFKSGQLLVPTHRQLAEALAFDHNARVSAVGQPSLEHSQLRAQMYATSQMRVELPGIENNKPTLLYAGGYDDRYAEAFEMFARASKDLSDFNVVIAPHPHESGEVERRLLLKTDNHQAIFLPRGMRTVDGALISDVVVSQRSTIGIQAIFMGKPVIYLDVHDTNYTDAGIRSGIATQVFSEHDFLAAVHATSAKATWPKRDVFKQLGIPRYSTWKIYSKIKQQLCSQSKMPCS